MTERLLALIELMADHSHRMLGGLFLLFWALVIAGLVYFTFFDDTPPCAGARDYHYCMEHHEERERPY